MAMRLKDRKLYPAVTGVSMAAVFVTWQFVDALHKPEFLLSGLGAVAAVAHFLYRQHLDNARFFSELFRSFNRTYDRLNDKLWPILTSRDKGELEPAQKLILQDYFNLCAEEWFYYQSGYVDGLVWDAWMNGMAQFVGDKYIRQFWEKECRGSSYYGFPIAESCGGGTS